MIGSPPFANNLSRVHLNGLQDSEMVNLIREEGYETGDAFGFVVEETEETLLSAHLLLTRPEVRQVFDEETQSVEKQEIQTIQKIPFRLDFKYDILEVFADQDSSAKVSSKISQLTNWDITVESANFSPLEVMQSIEEQYETELTSIKISNYPASDSVVGDFSADVDDQDVGRSLLGEYAGDLSYLGVRVQTDVDDVTLGIYDSGSIVVYNDMEGLPALLDVLKESVIGGDSSA